MKIPTISVIMPTYNHATFVAQAIKSVLMQVDVDFELLISDDGSQDKTRDVVLSFSDPRIHFYPNTINRGACVVTNELIVRARGEFIALINSDDCWISADKLATQLKVMRDNPAIGACFGRANFVDSKDNRITKSTLSFGSVFDQKNRSQGAWLRRFFVEGNCICHPTILISKSCYEQVGMYSNRLRQLPDFDMWIRLLKKYEIYIVDQEFINFRVLPGENAASQTPVNSIRTINEHYLIARTFFDDVSDEVFTDGFGDLFKYHGELTKHHLDIEKVLLYFDINQWLGRPYRMIGILLMRDLLESPMHLEIMERDYGVGDRWYQQQLGELDILRPSYLAVASQAKYNFVTKYKRVLSRILKH